MITVTGKAEPLASSEDLVFTVEQWTKDDLHVIEVLARAASVRIGRAAFQAAVAQRPGQRITLRQRAFAIARSHRVAAT